MALTKVADRMRVTGNVNVKDYNAVGDGSTDDTAAFVAAIAAGNSVYVPTGFYKLTSNIVLPYATKMYGDGRGETVLMFSGAINGLTISLHSTLNDMWITGDQNNAAASSNALLVFAENNSYRTNISNLAIGGTTNGSSTIFSVSTKYGGDAINSGNTFLVNISGCYIFKCLGFGWDNVLATGGGPVLNAVNISGTEFHDCNIGTRLKVIQGVSFDACTWENNTQEGLILIDVRSCSINAPYFEANNEQATGTYRADLYAEVAASLNITAGFWQRGANCLYGIDIAGTGIATISGGFFNNYTGVATHVIRSSVATNLGGFFSNTTALVEVPSSAVQQNWAGSATGVTGLKAPQIFSINGTTATLTIGDTEDLFTPATRDTGILTVWATSNNAAYYWSGSVQSFTGSSLNINQFGTGGLLAVNDNAGTIQLEKTGGGSNSAFAWAYVNFQ
tara:strand:- start:179 stop:1525 length:1347 start_codon:yes stop_codon:yes gene_type:complete